MGSYVPRSPHLIGGSHVKGRQLLRLEAASCSESTILQKLFINFSSTASSKCILILDTVALLQIF